MKHELPIAIILLAIGCMPWLWQHVTPLAASQSLQNSEDGHVFATEIRDYSAMQTLPGASAEESRKFLLRVASSIENGEPSIGNFQIENHLFESQLSGNGKFWCSGRGRNRSRFELIPNSDDAMITQVCDGRFVYRLIESAESRTLRFYDLEKLGSDDFGLQQDPSPVDWIGSNSVTGLLSTLADAFRFEPMKSSADGQQVELVGSWDPQLLAKLLINHIDHRSILPSPDWSKVPQQIPHGVRLRFTNQQGDWQPAEFLFFRFDDTQPASQLTAALTVRFSPLEYQAISDELFQIDSTGADTSEETGAYRRRIEVFTGKRRVADDARLESLK